MKPISHILCPVDFSEISELTLQETGKLAEKLSAKLTLLHVVSVIPASYGALYGIDFQAVDTVELTNSAAKALEEFRLKYVPESVKCRVVSVTGNVSSEINTEVKQSEVDLIVMATSGAHGVEEYLIGSNAAKVSRSATCPVLTASHPEKLSNISKVLIPLDISLGIKEIRHLIESFKGLENFSAELLVISEPGYRDPHPDATRLFMESQIKALHATGIETVTWKEIFSKDVAETICTHAEKENFGMIMMKSLGRSTFGKFLLGSTTEAVVNHSSIPVLTLKTSARENHERFSSSIAPNLW